MRSLPCPRCRRALSPISLGLHASGGYRDLAGTDASGLQCPGCGLGVVPGAVVEKLMQSVAVGGGMSERDRTPTRTGCPACLSSVDRLTLSWGNTFVEIEQCPRCRTMLLDAGEFPRVFVIEHGSKLG